jgi:YVTN family beta-propeller protein
MLALASAAAGTAAPGATAVGHPGFLSPHASPIVLLGNHVFAANTPADTVDVIDAASRLVVARIHVGIDPVGLAVRPDGKEVWVANHVSDSLSVIDSDPASPTYLEVVATVQEFDASTRATRFDEPVGIAFASNDKAYAALSSENQIAVIDVATRQVINRLTITAQDPRAIQVRGNRLYVIPFESHNRSQISGCQNQPLDSDLCTFDATFHVLTNNNVLSLGAIVDIVKNPAIPDRDLYVFDTASDQLVEIVDSLGTLLYGLTVDSAGRVFVAQADARNDANGRAGTGGDDLEEMENRAFLNQITRVDCNGPCGEPQFIDLEPLPPSHPAPGMALATPFAIEISGDDTTLVASAAGSNVLFTLDAETGAVLGRTEVGAVPRGIALESNGGGQAIRAWVLNAVANSVSLVDVSDPVAPTVVDTIPLEDPTHPDVQAGRMAFNAAAASTTGTFSCESCHPDGGTDQLVWILDTPRCNLPGCTQIPPRTTMPIRGLRDTTPYHWDGIPGDPFGGQNTANIGGSVEPNCNVLVPESCTRFLVDGSLGSVMCTVDACPTNDEGKAGALTGAERDAMAKFLLSVPYPPAQRRPYDNVLSSRAQDGFKLFHIDGDLPPGAPRNVCGNCHRMPFWVSTNTPGTGMDAPTWRGAYDRWLILPQGRLNIIDFDFIESLASFGMPEQFIWRLSWGFRERFDPVWDMVVEGSTGFSGSFGRGLTLSQTTADASLTSDLLDALEQSAREEAIVLQAEGALSEGASVTSVQLHFDPSLAGGRYVERNDDPDSFSRGELVALANAGDLVATFTGRAGLNVDVDHPQPALWTQGSMSLQSGPQRFPTLSVDDKTMTMSGRHIEEGARVIVDGRRVAGSVSCQSGELPLCSFLSPVEVQLPSIPGPDGIHFLQVQNPDGLVSNDFIFHTVPEPSRSLLALASLASIAALRVRHAKTAGARFRSNSAQVGSCEKYRNIDADIFESGSRVSK